MAVAGALSLVLLSLLCGPSHAGSDGYVGGGDGNSAIAYYAAILGGTLTLIGTSTNLIINSMMIEQGESGFAFFDCLRHIFPWRIKSTN